MLTENEVIHYGFEQTRYGMVLIGISEIGVCSVEFGRKAELIQGLKERFPMAQCRPVDKTHAALITEVVLRVNTNKRSIGARRVGLEDDFRLDWRGSSFQKQVWSALRKIPAGKTMSYSALAKKIRLPQGARAVANACAKNSIAILVPCHRVVRQSGELGGYRWGLDRKLEILKDEGVRLSDQLVV